MNYGNMTDFEINKLITKVMGFNLCEGQHYKPSVTHWLGGNCKMFDPCNNPSDAWPIIIENKISINHEIARYSADSLVYSKAYDSGFKIFSFNGEMGDTSSRAALRAAMIVFLMMQGEL